MSSDISLNYFVDFLKFKDRRCLIYSILSILYGFNNIFIETLSISRAPVCEFLNNIFLTNICDARSCANIFKSLVCKFKIVELHKTGGALLIGAG